MTDQRPARFGRQRAPIDLRGRVTALEQDARMNCTKVRYRTKLDAMIALASTQRSQETKREERRFYRCPDCRGWHLTSQKKHR